MDVLKHFRSACISELAFHYHGNCYMSHVTMALFDMSFATYFLLSTTVIISIYVCKLYLYSSFQCFKDVLLLFSASRVSNGGRGSTYLCWGHWTCRGSAALYWTNDNYSGCASDWFVHDQGHSKICLCQLDCCCDVCYLVYFILNIFLRHFTHNKLILFGLHKQTDTQWSHFHHFICLSVCL